MAARVMVFATINRGDEKAVLAWEDAPVHTRCGRGFSWAARAERAAR